MPSNTLRPFLTFAAGLSLAVFVACAGPTKTFHKPLVLGGKKVSARALTNGSQQFEIYCSACHGVNGDGKGPASIGLRPPPRDFRQGQFKFGSVSGGLPSDEDFARIISNFRNLPAVVARAEVRGDQVFGSGLSGNASRVFHCGVLPLARHINRIGTKSRFMDERGAFVRKLNRAF